MLRLLRTPQGRSCHPHLKLPGFPDGRLLARHGRVPPVHLIARFMPHERLVALIRRSDCSLSLSRGEGFGLTIAEAIGIGTPAVVTGWGAPPEFLGDRVAVLRGHRPWAATAIPSTPASPRAKPRFFQHTAPAAPRDY